VHRLSNLDFSVLMLDWSQAAARALPLRVTVFVEEQQVPADLEHDHWDALSVHALAVESTGRVLGTGRLLPDGHIGRMAVAREVRGRGVGSALLQALVQAGVRHGHEQLLLHAQLHAIPFYSRHGFQVDGPEFMDAGILHAPMACRFPQWSSD